MASNGIFRSLPKPLSKREIWGQFVCDKELLRQHNITDREIEILKTVVPLGTLTGVEDILFVLSKIRFERRR